MARRRRAGRGTAVKSDWKTEPMPESCTTIDINQEFSKDDMANIRAGFIPEVMEEKWFIYFDDSESKLYMHRSWTGYCMYIVNFEERGDKFVATTAIVNRDSSQYTCTDNDEDKRLAVGIIGSVLLGRSFSMGNPLEAWSLLGNHSLQ